MATNDQIVQYFLLLTENYLNEQYGSESGKKLFETFKKRFNELYLKNEDMMPDALSKQHAITPIFAIALSNALQNENITLEDLKNHILSIFRTILKSYLAKQGEELEVSDNPWDSFVKMCKTGNKQLYENEYFQLAVIHDDSKQFGFDINRCLYYEIFTKNGRPDLGPLLCDYDHILAGNVEKWVRFERTETIADGDSRCNFRYYRK
jgi:hypothetical protein